MDEISTYYVTLNPVREGAISASGMHHIAHVSDPAVEEVGIYLNEHDKRIVADETIKGNILEYLKNCGCVKPDNWNEVSEEDYLSAKEINLTTDPTSTESYNDFQKKGGGGQWLVRYDYSGPSDEKTRDFCSDILSLGRLYTEEEISNGLSNPEFGNYSIFDYKGSYGCRHVWKRKIFFEDYEDDEVRRVGFVPQVVMRLDDSDATTLNAYLSKDEKMQVIAPLLIPDKDIFRNDEIGRYNMRFSKETIVQLRDLAIKEEIFEREDLYKDTHIGGVAPSYTIDHWLSASTTDKAYADYGFDIRRNPIGTWFVHSQIKEKNYWEKEIKLNKKYAYSIEAFINLSIIKLSKMENDQIVLPEGEKEINGTIYIVKDGVIVEKDQLSEEAQEVVAEELEVVPAVTEEVVVEELTEEVVVEETVAPADDRMAKLEADQEAILMEIAKLRSELATPAVEEVAVAMSDERPTWRRISDGLTQVIKNKNK